MLDTQNEMDYWRKFMGNLLKIVVWILLALFIISLVITYWYVFFIIAIIVAIVWWLKLKNNKSPVTSKHANTAVHGPSSVIKIDNVANINKVKEQNSEPIKNDDQPCETSIDSHNTEFEDTDDNIKLADNLYLGDILFLNWLNGKEINEHVPGYIVNAFDINPIVEKRKLKSGNYIKEGSIGWRLNKLKVTDLKTILRNNNKKVSGRKKDLIQRIQDNIDQKQYIQQLPHVFELSDKGHELLIKYKLIIWAHSNSWLIEPRNFLPYIESDKSPIEISINLHEEKLKQIIKSPSHSDYYEFERYEDYLANLYGDLDDEENYVQHTINSAFLDYFLINSSVSGFYIEPNYYDTTRIQSQLINLIQKVPNINDLIFKAAIANFIKDYSSILPDYVKSNPEQMLKVLKDNITLSPQELHHKRVVYLKKHIVFE